MSDRTAPYPWLLLGLLFAVPALLPFSRAAEAPILLGALLGLYAALRDRAALQRVITRTLLLALGAYTLAALISAIDAYSSKTWSTALGSLRFLGFALGVLTLLWHALRDGADPARLSKLLSLAAALPIALWVADGLMQAASGWSIGGTLDSDRLSGIFGADDLKLGPLLSALSPLLLWPLLRARRMYLAAVWLGLLLVVLLAGARAGWLSFALVSTLLAWRLARGSWPLLLSWLAAAALCVAALVAISYHSSETFRARIDRTLAASDGQIDVALAGRVPIWKTATQMIAAHPINGVGARSFRYAYPDYADAGDPWVDPVQHTGASHAHQIILEVLTETGILGLLLWLAAAILLWRQARQVPIDSAAGAAWVSLAVLVFPLNTHLAFYSSFLSIVLAWLLTLACAQTLIVQMGEKTAASNAS